MMRTFAVCTCNCTCWFRRYQTSVTRAFDQIIGKGKGRGKIGKGKPRTTFTTNLASARLSAQSNATYRQFIRNAVVIEPQPSGNTSSSNSDASSGYRDPPTGYVSVLNVLRHYQVHIAHFSVNTLRYLRDLFAPMPAAMVNMLPGANPTEDDEPMPQRVLSQQERDYLTNPPTLEDLRDQLARAHHRMRQAAYGTGLIDTGATQNVYVPPDVNSDDNGSSTSSNMPALAAHDHRREPELGHGPHWIHGVSYIELSAFTAEPENTAYFTRVTHDIGFCERTGYLCTGTCLNKVEIEMLEKHCVFAPTAVLGGLIPPDNGEFRLAVLPPWARITFQNFWTHVRKSVIEYCLDNPMFAKGGEPVRLHAILEQHQADLHKFCDDAKAEYQNGHPTEADLWERLFLSLIHI